MEVFAIGAPPCYALANMPTPPVKFPKPNRSSGKPPVRKSDGNGNGSTPGPGSDQNWRGLILLTLTVLMMCALWSVVTHPGIAQEQMTQAQLFDLAVNVGIPLKIDRHPESGFDFRGAG